MTSVIIMQGNSLENFYEQTMDYLYVNYHIHPIYAPDLYIDEEMASEVGYYESMANDMADQTYNKKKIPLGKLVI